MNISAIRYPFEKSLLMIVPWQRIRRVHLITDLLTFLIGCVRSKLWSHLITSRGRPLIFFRISVTMETQEAKYPVGNSPVSQSVHYKNMAAMSDFASKSLEACEAGEAFIKEFYTTVDRRRNVNNQQQNVRVVSQTLLAYIRFLF